MIVSALLLLVLGIGLAGVVVTHKVAGPVFKMKRLLGELAKGHFRVVARLRKGDELQYFFDAFNEAAEQLERRQQDEIQRIEDVIEILAASKRPTSCLRCPRATASRCARACACSSILSRQRREISAVSESLTRHSEGPAQAKTQAKTRAGLGARTGTAGSSRSDMAR